ncbi:MAG TPA: class I SAM-dependent methyltransferase [Candidatus Ozemobacteraceae bacterium]|nr:class I SAM-dependent methyltransferase [Candidatus Ozemobacteraceae bacterium]
MNTEFWIQPPSGEFLENDYWNDEEQEKSKEFFILDGDFGKLERFLEKTGLGRDLERCLELLKRQFDITLGGAGIDLAGGNLWAVPYLLKSGRVTHLHCLERSHHRLFKLGPNLIRHYGIDESRITLVYGDFHDIHLPDGSLDFVFLSAAFHHAAEPKKLLREIRRVLKDRGVAIIIGEHHVDFQKAWLKNLGKLILQALLPAHVQTLMFGKQLAPRPLWAKTCDLFPPDPLLGDHFYSLREYRRMFTGFDMCDFHNPSNRFRSFVLVKR